MGAENDLPRAGKFMSFQADCAGQARVAASRWLGDFSQHGPLNIRAIRVVPKDEHFVAIVTYSDMALSSPAS